MAKGSSGKLADTTFNTSPDNKLNVVDVYESENSEIENSFQEEYHKEGGASENFKDIGNAPLDLPGGGGNPLDGLKDLAGGGDFNSILDGLKNGDLSSLTSLTGGSFGGLKQLSDMVNQAGNMGSGGGGFLDGLLSKAKDLVSAVTGFGNNLKGGGNNDVFVNKLAQNKPLAEQIKEVIRNVGTIGQSSSLESSMGRASNVLGSDVSSINTTLNGTRNKANDIEIAKKKDTPVSREETKVLVDKLKSINPQIGSAITELPLATQEALVRGFNNETVSKGIIVGNKDSAIAANSETSIKVLEPINKIIDSFNPIETLPKQVQDTGAVAVLISGVTNIANKAGLKNTFSTITKNIDNKDAIVNAAKPLLLRAVDEGDLDILIDLAKSKACKELKSFAPDLINKTCYNVLRPKGMWQQSFASYYKNIKIAFEIIDPNWLFYYTTNGKQLINGYCINSNAFLCDLIEAALNELKNSKLTDTNRQDVGNKDLTNHFIDGQVNIYADNFANQIEQQLEAVNKGSYTPIANNDSLQGIIDATVIEPTVIKTGVTLNYDNEKYLLLASVFIDNSIDSEIQKHFPFIDIRFKTANLTIA